jgi:hypothetical protein
MERRRAGHRENMARPGLDRSVDPANVVSRRGPSGPLVSGSGSKDPGYKKFLRSILIPEKLLQVFEIFKIHRVFPVY